MNATSGFNSQNGQADFLTLLTTQLRYQDPMEPVNQEAFISQLSQFSMLEGVEKLNNSFGQMLALQEITQGLNLVGKTVTWTDELTGRPDTGRVDQISVVRGKILASVDGNLVPISSISSVSAS